MSNDSQPPDDSPAPAQAKARAIHPAYLGIIAVALIAFGISRLPEPPPSYDVPDERLLTMKPVAEPHPGHAGSETCRECHRHNHDTWFHSYHRTMTQEATRETVADRFDDVHLAFHDTDKEFHLFMRDEQPWVRINYEPDLFAARSLQRREFPVVLLTGSHVQQNYWYPAGEARTLAMLPIAYLMDEQRWVPREATFLEPPNDAYKSEVTRWNSVCIRCHTTFGEPRRDLHQNRNAYHSQVAEFGISCESCHGPAGDHVRIQRNPDDPALRDLEDPIVNPAGLTHVRSTQVCGACHSINKTKDGHSDWRAHHPGDDLFATRIVDRGEYLLDDADDPTTPDGAEEPNPAADAGKALEEEFETDPDPDSDLDTPEDLAEGDEGHGAEPDQYFWLDGMVRVGGREYNSLLRTACHTNGTLSCMSCHTMHQSKDDPRPVKEWADNQLRHDALNDQACLQCHESGEFATPAHTHHAAGSSGSSCYNCHMPHTSYALLKAIRSHTIWSPNARETASVGRPNACNLCHLDKSLGWTADRLHEWYGQAKPELSAEQRLVSQGVLHLLKGDAAQRALTAWGAGWEPAVAASGTNWLAPYLSLLLDDPYSGVRIMAERSLRKQADYRDFEYDFIAEPAARTASVERALKLWQPTTTAVERPAILMGTDGWKRGRAEELKADRDDRPISLLE